MVVQSQSPKGCKSSQAFCPTGQKIAFPKKSVGSQVKEATSLVWREKKRLEARMISMLRNTTIRPNIF